MAKAPVLAWLTLMDTPMVIVRDEAKIHASGDDRLRALLALADLSGWDQGGRDPQDPNVTWFFLDEGPAPRSPSTVTVTPAIPAPSGQYAAVRLLMFPLSMFIARFPNCGEKVDTRLLHPRAREAHAATVARLASEQVKLSKQLLEELRSFYASR